MEQILRWLRQFFRSDYSRPKPPVVFSASALPRNLKRQLDAVIEEQERYSETTERER